MTGLLIQEFKTLIKSPASISILIIPLVLLVGLGYLLPAGWIVPSSITIGIVAAVLLYFGGSIEEIKRTSFMKSVSLTRLSKFSFLATKILFAMMVSVVTVLWVLLFSWIFTETPVAFLATDFGNLLGTATDGNAALTIVAKIPFTIQWQNVQWFNMLYAGIVTILVAVSLSFVFVAFSKSSLSFYLMSFGYLLAMILFGGVVMPGFLISPENQWFKSLYYLVPNFYTNNIMAQSFSGGLLASAFSSLNNDLIAPILSSNLAHILGANVDPEVFANATTEELSAVQTLINEGSLGITGKPTNWNGSMIDLDTWYNGLSDEIKNSEYISQVYTILSLPKTMIDPNTGVAFADWSTYVGWGVMRNALSDIVNVAGLNPNIINIIDKITIDAVGLSAWNVVGNLFISGSFYIPFVIDITLPFSFYDIVVVNGLQGQNNLPITINEIGNELAPILKGMFGSLDWWNWPVPWIEGAVFLGISIKFFKWS